MNGDALSAQVSDGVERIFEAVEGVGGKPGDEVCVDIVKAALARKRKSVEKLLSGVLSSDPPKHFIA